MLSLRRRLTAIVGCGLFQHRARQFEWAQPAMRRHNTRCAWARLMAAALPLLEFDAGS